ncbi:MAG: 2-oxoacid:acceptor oxidoreductase family protein [Candidatus Bathyarchaeia archaeon]
MRREILISGTGGQGIVAAGELLSKSLFNIGYEVIFGRSYGSEARGGACRSEIIVSDEEIYDLQLEEADIFIALSVPGYTKYIDRVRGGALVIVDSAVLDDARQRKDVRTLSIPASMTAKSLGNPIVSNMVLLGALAKHSDILKLEMLRNAVKEDLPPSMHEINYKALKSGYNLA